MNLRDFKYNNSARSINFLGRPPVLEVAELPEVADAAVVLCHPVQESLPVSGTGKGWNLPRYGIYGIYGGWIPTVNPFRASLEILWS